MKKKDSLKVTYASFSSRMFANLIDLFIMGFLFLPFFYITSSFIYDGVLPSEVLFSIMQEVTQLEAEGIQVDVFRFVKENQRFKEYFYTQHGFIKIFIDQFVQFSILGCVLLIFWIKKQSTPGKICLNLKIVDANTLGKPTNKQFVIRLFACVISVLPLCLGMLWILFDPKKQSWHDKFANTLVIKK